MLQYCTAIFSKYHFKGSMTKKEDQSNGCKTDLKSGKGITQRSPENML